MKIQRKKNQNQMKKFPFERLSELQDKRNADERFLSHREQYELMRLQADEIGRLRRCAAFMRCCALSGEQPDMTIEEFEVSNE